MQTRSWLVEFQRRLRFHFQSAYTSGLGSVRRSVRHSHTSPLNCAEWLEQRNLLSRTVSVAAGVASLSGSGDGLSEDIQVFVVSSNIRLSDANNPLTAGTGTTQIDANTVEFTTALTNMALSTGTGADALTVDFSAGNPVPSGGLTIDGGGGSSDEFNVIGSASDDMFELNFSGSNLVLSEFAQFSVQITTTSVEVVNANLGAGVDYFHLVSIPSSTGVTDISIFGEGDNDTFLAQPCELSNVLLDGGAPSPVAGGMDRLIIDLEDVMNPQLALSATGGGVLTSGNRQNKTATGIEGLDVINGGYELTVNLSQLPTGGDGSPDVFGLAVDPELTAYRFTEMARGDIFGPLDFTQFFEQPAINNDGEVAFIGQLDANGGTRGVFKADGSTLTTIATQGQMLDASNTFANHGSFATNTTINAAGTVLFDGRLDGGGTDRSGVFGGSGGAITTFGPPADNPFVGPNFFSGSVINDAGNALMYGGVSFGADLYLGAGDGSGASVFYDSSSIVSPANIGAFFGTDVAGLGNLFAAVAGSGPGVFQYIVRGDGGALTKIVDAFDPSYGISSSSLNTNPSLNSSGTVAFIAQQANGGPLTIYTGNGGSLTNFVDTSGPYNLFNSNFGPAINENGDIAFLATLDVGNVTGIFTGPDPFRDKVIQVGDPLLGSTVTGLEFNRFGLNDSGQLSFFATLANGEQVIARAEPTPDRLLASLNTATIFEGSLQNISALHIIGSSDDDTISADLSLDPVSILATVTVDAGGQGVNGDAISLSGGLHDEVIHTFTNANDGSILIDSVLTINYTGLEPISDSLSAIDRSFIFGGTADAIVLSDDETAGNGFLRVASTASSETVDFAAPSNSLTIQSGAANDSITVSGVDSKFNAKLLIDGGINDDSFVINLALTGSTTLLGSDGLDSFTLGPSGSLIGTIDGGSGSDTLSYATRSVGVTVNLGTGTASSLTGALTSVENVTGSSGADNITGSSDANALFGNSGADTLVGQEGADNINGGSGNDLISGGAGNDTLFGGIGTDTVRDVAYTDFVAGVARSITLNNTSFVVKQGATTLSTDLLSGLELADMSGGAMREFFDASSFTSTGITSLSGGGGNDTIIGTAGADVILTLTGADSINAGAGADVVFAGSGNDTINGGDGNDNLGGQNGNDSMLGNDGNDVLVGGAGIDTINGGLGNDFLSGQTDAGLLFGSDGNDTLQGNTANDTLQGELGDDRLYGLQGNDVLLGGDGVDSLVGSTGDDSLDGGAGTDTLQGDVGNDTLNGGADFDRINEVFDTNLTIVGINVTTTGLGTDSVSAIERIQISGGASNNFFDARQATVPLFLFGGTGNDTLLGGSKSDGIFGSDGDDVLSGGASTDIIDGGSGSDYWLEKADTSFTVNGTAITSAVTGTETPTAIERIVLIGGAGANTLDASLATLPVVLIGGPGNDTLLGGSASDTLTGGNRNDATVVGGDGVDSLDGGAGADVLETDSNDDIVVGSGDTSIADVFTLLPSWIDAL